MVSFSEALHTALQASGILNITCFIESMPMPSILASHYVGIFNSGDQPNSNRLPCFRYTRRLLITGDPAGAMAKAQEIQDWFISKNETIEASGNSFKTQGYNVHKTLLLKEASLVQNTGNIYFAELLLEFITSKTY